MKFEIKTDNTRRRSPVRLEFNFIDQPDPSRPIGEELYQKRYTISATASVDFWSNGAQLERKSKQAERMVLSHFYKDLLPLVEEILLHSDDEQVLTAAGILRDAMLGAQGHV